jgi:hypothetical protein
LKQTNKVLQSTFVGLGFEDSLRVNPIAAVGGTPIRRISIAPHTFNVEVAIPVLVVL